MMKVPDFISEISENPDIIANSKLLRGCYIMSILIQVSWVFAVAVLLTGLIKKIAPRFQLLDLPVQRSSHSKPTPVGGGLSIVLLFLLLASQYFFAGLLSLAEYMAIAAAGFIAVLGLIDDLRHLDIRWRLPLQCVAAIWSVAWLGDVPAIDFGGVSLGSSWFLNGLAVLALVWLLNLYNFMDGIDGIAVSEMLFVTLVAALVLNHSGDNAVALLSLTLFASGAGFLLWNWPPAKIFMGDVGSGFIGFCLGLLALITMHHGSMTIWTWLLLLGVFIVDAMVTLARRFYNGEKWYEGHAAHAYQKAAKRYNSHAKVTITVLIINCLWLAPLAWLSVLRPELGLILSVIGFSPLLVLALKLEAGIPVKLAMSVDPESE